MRANVSGAALLGIALMGWGGASLATQLGLTGWSGVNLALFALGIMAVASAPAAVLLARVRSLETQLSVVAGQARQSQTAA